MFLECFVFAAFVRSVLKEFHVFSWWRLYGCSNLVAVD